MISFIQLKPEHFGAIIALGNHVHGDNYLDEQSIEQIYTNSWYHNINSSWVAIDTAPKENDETKVRMVKDGLLIGFRLTLAPNNWHVDKWCSPHLWAHSPDAVCYFKCNTVDANYRGEGIGKHLLLTSIQSAKAQGAKAGLAHIWLASPNNSAFGYFSACGGQLIKEHPNKWQIHSIEDDYDCPVCGDFCVCVAAEMLLPFDKSSIDI